MQYAEQVMNIQYVCIKIIKKNIVNNKNYSTELNANNKNVYKIKMKTCYAKITIFSTVNKFQTRKVSYEIHIVKTKKNRKKAIHTAS